MIKYIFLTYNIDVEAINLIYNLNYYKIEATKLEDLIN